MKEIMLTQGKVTVVDDEDYAYLSQWKWCAAKCRHIYKAARAIRDSKKQYTIYMHRVIMLAPRLIEVDHIDGDGLNNLRSNLRLCSDKENARNSKLPSTNTSGFKGVSYVRYRDEYRVRIGVDGIYHHLGYFKDPILAAQTYDMAAEKYFGEFAKTNKSLGLL